MEFTSDQTGVIQLLEKLPEGSDHWTPVGAGAMAYVEVVRTAELVRRGSLRVLMDLEILAVRGSNG